jgi:lysozyme
MKALYERAALAVAGYGVRRVAAAMVLSAAGATALVGYEGSVPVVYLDPVGIPTVCEGHTKTVTKADVGKDMGALCTQLLKDDTADAVRDVRKVVSVPITQEQFDALVSFTFNVGGGALRSSTLLRKLNAGDCWGAGSEFPRWNKAKGRVLPGLVKRRAAERQMFETGCHDSRDPQGSRDPLQAGDGRHPHAYLPSRRAATLA